MACNLVFKNRHWWYRKTVPASLRAAIGKREILFPLGTENKAQAQLASVPYRIKAEQMIAEAREAMFLRDIALAYSGKEAILPPTPSAKLRAALRAMAWGMPLPFDGEPTALARAAASMTAPHIRAGAPVAPASISYAAGAADPQPGNAHLISELIDDFVSEIVKRAGGVRSTELGYRSALGKLIDVIGDKPVDAITEKDCGTFYDALVKAGNGRNSVVKDVRAVKRLCRWCKLRGFAASNPAAVMEVDIGSNEEHWEQFTRNDIETMMAALPHGDHRRMFVLLMLHTGLDAPSELEKLDRKLFTVNGRLHFFTRGTKDANKGGNRVRYIPTHSTLLTLGIETWLASLVWTPKRYQQWFNRDFIRTTGIKSTGKKSLKSFRSTFRSALTAIDGIRDETIDKLMGHAPKGTGAKSYGNRDEARIRRLSQVESDQIDKVSFGIDFGA
jgi:integrase